MKYIFNIARVVLAFLFIFSCNTNTESSIEEEVARINKSCPQMLDEETRLEKVVYFKPSLIIYNYTLVNLAKANVDTAQFRTALWPGILSGIRVDKDLEGLREKQINFEYRYYDKAKQLIYTFKISPRNYQL